MFLFSSNFTKKFQSAQGLNCTVALSEFFVKYYFRKHLAYL